MILIEWINGWAQGIIIALVIATIVEMLLPNGKNKKYVKTIIGIYIMFTIIAPIISKFSNVEIEFKDIDNYFNTNKIDVKTIEVSSNKTIEQTYIKKLEKDIKDKLKEKGYRIIDVQFKINIDDEKNYGTIGSVILKIQKAEDTPKNSQKINSIQPINISIGDNNMINEIEENVNELEKEEIKTYIEEIYGVSKNQIFINQK